MSPRAWRKSSKSGNGPNCVEVGVLPAQMAVRDTKDREGGTLTFDKTDWAAFLASVR